MKTRASTPFAVPFIWADFAGRRRAQGPGDHSYAPFCPLAPNDAAFFQLLQTHSSARSDSISEISDLRKYLRKLDIEYAFQGFILSGFDTPEAIDDAPSKRDLLLAVRDQLKLSRNAHADGFKAGDFDRVLRLLDPEAEADEPVAAAGADASAQDASAVIVSVGDAPILESGDQKEEKGKRGLLTAEPAKKKGCCVML